MIKIIGLVDYDFLQSNKNTIIIPNLEILKLSTYYRLKNKFCRLLTLEEKELTNYEKIYCFSETGTKFAVPNLFKISNNVIYGGSAFTNKKYVPFKESAIDYIIPKINIYQDFLKQKYDEGVKHLVISHVLDDTYYRMYAGVNQLPIPPIKKNKRVFIFDRNFFSPKWEEILSQIIKHEPSGIYYIHPIVCKTLTQFEAVRNYPKITRINKVILDLEIPLNEVNYMLISYKDMFLKDIPKCSNIYLPLKSNWITIKPYYQNLIYILNILYSFWAKNFFIKLYVEEPEIGINNPIIELEKFIMEWSTNKKGEKTILEAIGKRKFLKEQYNKIIATFPHSKTLFEQSRENLHKRGVWKI